MNMTALAFVQYHGSLTDECVLQMLQISKEASGIQGLAGPDEQHFQTTQGANRKEGFNPRTMVDFQMLQSGRKCVQATERFGISNDQLFQDRQFPDAPQRIDSGVNQIEPPQMTELSQLTQISLHRCVIVQT